MVGCTVDGIRAEIRMREHYALRLARCAGRVDDGREIVARDLRGPAAIFGNVGVRGGCDQRFVSEEITVNVGTECSGNHVLEGRHSAAALEDLFGLRCSRGRIRRGRLNR